MNGVTTPAPTWVPPALTTMQSALISIEPHQVGPDLKLDVYVSYWDPTLTQKNIELALEPRGLWNGLAPLVFFLQSGTLPGYQRGTPPQGPKPPFDLSRITGTLPTTPAASPPPSVDWPFSRRTVDQHNVDAGELDASGQPTIPEGSEVVVRPPSYSGPYATTPTDTENDINKAALTTPP